MRVAVIMFYDDAIKSYGDINAKINKRYCKKHNIEFIVSNTRYYDNRHPAWERLPLILRYIEDYDYLVWIDADAFFYIDGESIVKVIEEHPDKNFIFSKDSIHNNINTGILIVKNSKYCIDFIKLWAFNEELYRINPHPYWWDQGVLIYMYQQNIYDIQNNQFSYEYGELQHFYEEELKTLPKKPFIYHLAGKSHFDRIKASSEYYDKI